MYGTHEESATYLSERHQKNRSKIRVHSTTGHRDIVVKGPNGKNAVYGIMNKKRA
jgi:hypothetical protein